MYIGWITQPNKTILQLATVLLLSLVLFYSAGCSRNVTTSMDASSDYEVVSMLPVPDSTQLPAVIKRLMDLADQQYYKSKIPEAVSTLERAIRIKPHYPEIWARMAFVYSSLGEFGRSIKFAERSNTYLSNNHPLKQFNDELIASAKGK